MKTTTINLYEFNELSQKAKQKALNDYEIDDLWHDSAYDDAQTIELKITGFDVYERSIEGELTDSLPVVIDLILKNHGVGTDTYLTALHYQKKMKALELENNETEADEEKANELEEEFLREILKDYLKILTSDYDYMSSDECKIEMFKANEFTFEESGEIRNI